MPYRIVATIDEWTPKRCKDCNDMIIFGKSDTKSPPHALTEDEHKTGCQCKCVLVETSEV